MEGTRDWTMACLKVARMGHQQGEGRKQPALRERVNGVRDWAANYFKRSETGHREGEGRRRVTLRVIELCSALSPETSKFARGGLHLSSVKVEEHEGFSNGP